MAHLFCVDFGGCNTEYNPVHALQVTGHCNVAERLNSNDKEALGGLN